MRNDIAHPEVVGKSICLHFLRKDICRSTKLVYGFKLIGQVPLAFIVLVVSRLSQQTSHSSDIGGHTLDPGEVGIVEHPRVLNMLSGVDDRARWRTDTGVDSVIQEGGALFPQPFMGG